MSLKKRPNKRNIEFPMHSKSFVKGTKMAVVTSGENQELGYTCIFDASDCFIHIYIRNFIHIIQ